MAMRGSSEALSAVTDPIRLSRPHSVPEGGGGDGGAAPGAQAAAPSTHEHEGPWSGDAVSISSASGRLFGCQTRCSNSL